MVADPSRLSFVSARKIIQANARIYAEDGDLLRTYRDHYNRLAIGYDHTRSTLAGQSISNDEAEILLTADLEWLHRHTLPLIDHATLTAPQWAALLSFAHSLPFGDFRQTTALARIRCGRLGQVPAEMALHTGHGGRTLRMLVRRRADEGKLWAAT
jgi:GH24 family phage-related lysozyme (muramidase)